MFPEKAPSTGKSPEGNIISHVNTDSARAKAFSDPVRQPSDHEIQEFLNKLEQSDKPVAILSIFIDHQQLIGSTSSLIDEVTLPPPLPELYDPKYQFIPAADVNQECCKIFDSGDLKWTVQ